MKTNLEKARPNTVQCFTWLAGINECLTRCNLQKGMTICSRSPLCKEELEDTNHLFLLCKFTSQLWDLLLTMLGIKSGHTKRCPSFSSRLDYRGNEWYWLETMECHPCCNLVDHMERKRQEFFKINWKMLLVSSFFAFLCFPFGAIWQICMIYMMYGPCSILLVLFIITKGSGFFCNWF